MLYGRDGLLSLVERHVGLGMADDRLIKSARSGCPPVILASGGRGAGKTALLDELSGNYGNRAPLVKRDIAAPRYSDSDRSLAPGDTTLLRLLRDLKFELELKVKDNGNRIRLPRLSAGLIAVATWQADWGDDTEITLAKARQLLEAKTRAFAKIAPRPAGESWVEEWIDAVLAGLGGGAVPFPASVFVQATVHAFVKKALSVSQRGVPIKWHQDFDPRAAGDGYEVLVMLGRDHSAEGNLRAKAERAIVAAFLADLGAAYGGPSWLSPRRASPLVLLDNITDNPVGSRFLELVPDCRARPGAKRDPLVVIGCVPESFRLKPAAAAPESVCRMELTPLSLANAVDMLEHADHRRFSGYLDQLIIRVTGGLPLGVAVITEAVKLQAPETGGTTVSGGNHRNGTSWVDGSSLLDLPSREPGGVSGPPVSTCLLRRLIPDEKWRGRLAMLSCARDADEAQKLVDTYLARDARTAAVPGAERYLRASGWATGGGYFVSDPFLRVLLYHQFQMEGTNPASAQAHAMLRDHYGETESTGALGSSEPSRLYHCLALGDTSYVARRLRESFDTSTAQEWLAALVQVAAAPCGTRPDIRRDTALGEHDDPDQDDIHRSVNRLLHAAWYLHDPLVAPDNDVIGKLRDELKALAFHHRPGNRAFTDAADDWPERLESWQQDWKPTT